MEFQCRQQNTVKHAIREPFRPSLLTPRIEHTKLQYYFVATHFGGQEMTTAVGQIK